MSRRLGLFAIGALVALGSVVFYFVFDNNKNQNPQETDAAELWQEAECWFEIPRSRSIRCGYLSSLTAHQEFLLPVVIFQDRSQDHNPDPVVYVNGGPGSSNFLEAGAIQHWLDWMDTANLSRDLIVMDHRGTGLSRPQFRCGGYEAYVRETLSKNLNSRADSERLLSVIAKCIEQFNQSGFTFKDYSTLTGVQDLSNLKEALEYEAWNLMGSSYGTRVAITWSQRFPKDVRSMVLDSVYPPGFGGLLHWPENLASSFNVLWEGCLGDNQCADDQISETHFWETVNRLNRNPIPVQISLWEGGWPLQAVINGHRFIFVAYSALYRSSGPENIIKTIAELGKGESDTLSKLVEQSVNSDLDPSFNPFTYFMVDCAENYRPTVEEFEVERRRFPSFDAITVDAVAQDVCGLFPLLENIETFIQLSNDNTPTLFLSGGRDPVTPVRWVDAIKFRYPNGQQWLMPNLSHGVSANSECVLKGIRQFLDDPTTTYPNTCATSD